MFVRNEIFLKRFSESRDNKKFSVETINKKNLSCAVKFSIFQKSKIIPARGLVILENKYSRKNIHYLPERILDPPLAQPKFLEDPDCILTRA